MELNLEDKLKELTSNHDVITKISKKDIQFLLDNIINFEYSDQIFFIDQLIEYLDVSILDHENCQMFFNNPYIQKILKDIVT